MKRNYLLLVFLFILSIPACSRKIYKIAYPTLSDGRYDSEFPYKNCSQELKEISESVTKVFCITYYKSFYFLSERKVTRKDITNELLAKADETKNLKNTVAGTGTVIYFQNNRIAILTCAHVVSKADTLISYYSGEGGTKSNYIQSLSIKEKQENLVFGMPEEGTFDIVLINNDNDSDIAILIKELKRSPNFITPVFSYPFGKAKELEWGSFVYLIGYPMGYKIITKGIVSQPDRDKKGSFFIDATFNRGLSGGILLAIKDGVPNFELVGITTSAAAEYETVLVPERERDYDENVPYEGKIYVDNKRNINYGITRAIAAESILNLLSENRDYLVKKGYDFKFF